MAEIKKLAIKGKVITFNDIMSKSLAQFKQQLKQNGVVIEDETAERLWMNLRGEQTEEQKAAKAAAEAKAAEMKAAAEAKAAEMKAAAEAKAAEMKAAAEAKFNINKKGE